MLSLPVLICLNTFLIFLNAFSAFLTVYNERQNSSVEMNLFSRLHVFADVDDRTFRSKRRDVF